MFRCKRLKTKWCLGQRQFFIRKNIHLKGQFSFTELSDYVISCENVVRSFQRSNVMNIALCSLKMRRIWSTVSLKQTDKAKLWVQPVLVFAVRKLDRHQRSTPPWQASQWACWYLSATLWRSARVAKTVRIWKADFFLKNTSKRSGLPVSDLCMLPGWGGQGRKQGWREICTANWVCHGWMWHQDWTNKDSIRGYKPK